MIERFRRSSIRLQFIVLAAIPIPAVLLSVIAILPEPFIFQNGPQQKSLAVKRAQIELVVNQLRDIPDAAAANRLVAATAATGLDMRIAPWSAVSASRERHVNRYFISDELRRVLPPDFDAVVLDERRDDAGYQTLALRVDGQRAVLIRFSDDDTYTSFFSAIVELIAKIVMLILPMLVLVLYIGGMITSPLIRFAEAAKRLRLDDNEDELFAVAGAEELRALAAALNDMRRRIRKMVDDRTRMLTAISHDLRTPLTRLRMRVERSHDSASREAMLADIATLTNMIEESLQYLSSTARAEPLRKVDIASLLETIAAEFGDLGHVVSYSGPDRLVYLCRQKALVRAITNIVENAVKFGTVVSLELRGDGRGGAVIVVNDNGPGLEDSLHDKALEPFFKADTARGSSANGGFGLGLSIADEIVRGHGGSLSLANLSPHGLRVTMELPRQTIVAASAADPGDKAPAGNGRALEQNAIVLKN